MILMKRLWTYKFEFRSVLVRCAVLPVVLSVNLVQDLLPLDLALLHAALLLLFFSICLWCRASLVMIVPRIVCSEYDAMVLTRLHIHFVREHGFGEGFDSRRVYRQDDVWVF